MNSQKYKLIWEEIRKEVDRIFLPLKEQGHDISITNHFGQVDLMLILANKPETKDWIWLSNRPVTRDPLLKLVKVTPPISTKEELLFFSKALEFIADQHNDVAEQETK